MMNNVIKVAMIGIDTSHSTEFPYRMQAPDCPSAQRVAGMKVVRCLSFMTSYTDEKTMAERAAKLTSWGVNVTSDFSEAVKDCDAVMLEINDPAYHLEYFMKCVELKKPIFLDKPFADNSENALKMKSVAEEKGVKVFTASALRFSKSLVDACGRVELPKFAHVYGPISAINSGDGVIWYGVHTIEMMNRVMGSGAKSLVAVKDDLGIVCTVRYEGGRKATAHLMGDTWRYGGVLCKNEGVASYEVDLDFVYNSTLKEILAFFSGGHPPVSLEDSYEVMRILDAIRRSAGSGDEEVV